MGFRFRKRIKVAPGLHVNVTKNGISSASVGVKGYTVNVKKDRTTHTISVPGSGLSSQQTFPKPCDRRADDFPVEGRRPQRYLGLIAALALILLAFFLAR